MKTIHLTDGISLQTMNVEGLLFEGMWEMPKGVTLNSYIVKGQETAIIDGFCGWDGVPETLFKLLDEAKVELDSIRYLIVNHMEPDHSGWIEDFMKLHTNFDIYCTKEAAALLRAFFDYDNRIHEITDGEELDLGNGKVLQFLKTPNVHWPDTMMTFEKSSGILFSCDAFGSFGMLEKNLESENTEEELVALDGQQIRYFSNILGTFSPMVGRAIDKVRPLPIQVIAPGHGLVWDKNPSRIMDDYVRYVAYQKGNAKDQVVIIHGSMYGMTTHMVAIAEDYLAEKGIPCVSLKVPETDLGTLLEHAWEAKGLIIAAPTYEYKMFPPAATAMEELGKKRLNCRKMIYFGSYGWSGGALKEFNEILERNRMSCDVIAGIEFNGMPQEDKIAEVKLAIDHLVEAW